MTLKKTKLVLGIATAVFTLTGAMVSTEASAHTKRVKGKIVKHTHKKVKRTTKAPAYVAPAYAAPAPVAADNSGLQSQVDSLTADVNRLKAQPAPVAPEVKQSKDNMVFFRGGWAHSNRDRNGISINDQAVLRNTPAPFQGDTADKNGWYFGAGLDFSVDDNLFGLMDKTEVLGEVMFEYKEFANKVYGNALTGNLMNGVGANTGTTNALGLGTTANRNVTVSQFTLSASPKIKFLKNSPVRPWIIPIGFKIDVISPPSNSITVLQPGMMFGAGVDYNLWKNIYVGVDARYHHALGGGVDGVNTNGFTAGGYLGLGF